MLIHSPALGAPDTPPCCIRRQRLRERFIERNTRTAWRIEALQRENIPEYPMKALREVITNAVMHRDWFIEGANIFVELYTDRIEVVSPGGLPKGMTLADLGTKSVRRNGSAARQPALSRSSRPSTRAAPRARRRGDI